MMANKAPKRGIMMFAHNNQEINYLELAIINGLLAQKNLGLTADQVTIVTDSSSYDYCKTIMAKDLERASTNYILVDTDFEFKYNNTRLFKDTQHTPKVLPFYNINRCNAYDLSPYEETILIDADFLVLSSTLNNCWGHNNELMMNWEYRDAMADRVFPELARLNPLGITMYWATVVYFRKTPEVESFFNMVKHVKDNREYYSELYKFNNGVYRNDYSFSIAAHMWSGYQDKGVPQLPVVLYKTFDNDDIYKMSGDTLYLYLEKPRSPGDFMLCNWQGIDLHVMNKWALGRISNELRHNALTDDEPETDQVSVVKRQTNSVNTEEAV